MNPICKLLSTTLIICFFSSSALSSNSEKSNFALGVGGGTTGISVNATYQLTKHINIRGIYASYDLEDQDSKSGIDYDFNVELDTLSLLFDYHPFQSSGFRLSLGAVKNGTSFSATSTQTSGTMTVGSSTFNASDVGTLNASVSYNDIAPYVGIGWGNAVMGNKNLSLAFDIGVIGMDSPDIQLTSSGTNSTIQAALDTEIENERQELSSSLDDFDLFPVINLSFNYQF